MLKLKTDIVYVLHFSVLLFCLIYPGSGGYYLHFADGAAYRYMKPVIVLNAKEAMSEYALCKLVLIGAVFQEVGYLISYSFYGYRGISCYWPLALKLTISRRNNDCIIAQGGYGPFTGFYLTA